MWRDLNPVIAGAKRLIADPKLEIIVIETLGLASDYNLDDRAMHAQQWFRHSEVR
jgi:hypothetical protein